MNEERTPQHFKCGEDFLREAYGLPPEASEEELERAMEEADRGWLNEKPMMSVTNNSCRN